MPKFEIINVKIDYSDEELIELGERITKLYDDKYEYESAKKSNADHYNSKIKKCETEIKELCEEIKNKYHIEPVECIVTIDEVKQEKVFIHPDTREEVHREPYVLEESDSIFAN